MPHVRVFFHDHCFDGSASAAMFSAFHRSLAPGAEFSFWGLTHKTGDLFATAEFSGDENAIVDFKFCSDARVGWWFDHHQSAFLSPADAAQFRRDASPHKFYDPTYGSCTKFIADVARERFGFDSSRWTELIAWADRIDQAQFPSAQAAIELKEPALQLTLVIESSTTPGLLRRIIPDFLALPLAELVNRPYIQAELQPLLRRHWASLDQIRGRIECRDGVIFFDLSDLDLEGYNKFIPYYFHPEGVYSIGISRSPHRMKVSVGTNPWRSHDQLANLASLCERYGGGGHPRVGAISFAPDELEQARLAARELVAELRGGATP